MYDVVMDVVSLEVKLESTPCVMQSGFKPKTSRYLVALLWVS